MKTQERRSSLPLLCFSFDSYKDFPVKNNFPILRKSYDDLPLFLNAEMVARVLGVSPSSGYELLHKPGFPVLRVGSRMVVPKEQFIQWVSDHTGGGG